MSTIRPRTDRHRARLLIVPGRGRRPRAEDGGPGERLVIVPARDLGGSGPAGAGGPDAGGAGGAGGKDPMRAVARGGAANLVGAAVTTAANLLLSIVVARALSTSDAGVFFSITSLVLLLSTFSRLGTGNGLVYFLPRLRLNGSPEEVGVALRLSFRPTVYASLGIGALLFLFAPQVAGILGDPGNTKVIFVLRLIAVTLPFAALGDVLQSATRGFNRMRTTVVVEKIARPAAQLVLIIAAAPTGSVVLVILAWTLPYVPATIVSLLPVRRLAAEDRVARFGRSASGFDRREYWWFTAPRAATALAQIVLQRLDVILVAAIVSPSAAALYAAATRFLVVGQIGNQAITLALQPRLSAALARRNMPQANMLYQTSTAWLVLMTWPLYLLLLVFPAGALSIFGHRYTEATEVVVILCSAMLVATACGQVDSVLMMAGRSTWNMGNAVLALVVAVALDLLLLPRIGITGAAIGWAAAILLNNLIPLSQVWWSTRLHPFGRGTLMAAAVSSTAVLIWAVPIRLLAGDALGPAFVAGMLALLLLTAVTWVLRRPLGLTLFSFRR